MFVTDDLDDRLDWSTSELREVAFGSNIVTSLSGHDSRAVRAPLPGTQYVVDISAGLDHSTGRTQWTLRTIDPMTGQLPTDPNAGFLPPNDSAGSGEGHVTFVIRPLPGLVAGTRIANKATIAFDVETPVTTNEWFNTIGMSGIASAKHAADGSPVVCSSDVVTALFDDGFYVESDDRSHGVRVQGPTHNVSAGRRVEVVGNMRAADNDERYIDALVVTANGSGTVRSVGMTNGSVVGGDWFCDPVSKSGQRGITGSYGPNNIRMLVTTWGTVTASRSSTGWMYVNDGSRVADGTGIVGLYADAPGLSVPAPGTFVAVTGISSCEVYLGRLVNVLKPRSQGDIVILGSGPLRQSTGNAESIPASSAEHPRKH